MPKYIRTDVLRKRDYKTEAVWNEEHQAYEVKLVRDDSITEDLTNAEENYLRAEVKRLQDLAHTLVDDKRQLNKDNADLLARAENAEKNLESERDKIGRLVAENETLRLEYAELENYVDDLMQGNP